VHTQATTECCCKHASWLSLAEHRHQKWQADDPWLASPVFSCFALHSFWNAGCQHKCLTGFCQASYCPNLQAPEQLSDESSNAAVMRSHLEECQNVWVCQAVLIAAEEVGHLAETLLPNAQLPQAEGYVPPLLVVLHTDRQITDR